MIKILKRNDMLSEFNAIFLFLWSMNSSIWILLSMFCFLVHCHDFPPIYISRHAKFHTSFCKLVLNSQSFIDRDWAFKLFVSSKSIEMIANSMQRQIQPLNLLLYYWMENNFAYSTISNKMFTLQNKIFPTSQFLVFYASTTFQSDLVKWY